MSYFDDEPEPSSDTISLEEVRSMYPEEQVDRLLQYVRLRGDRGSEYWLQEDFDTIIGLDEIEFSEPNRIED